MRSSHRGANPASGPQPRRGHKTQGHTLTGRSGSGTPALPDPARARLARRG